MESDHAIRVCATFSVEIVAMNFCFCEKPNVVTTTEWLAVTTPFRCPPLVNCESRRAQEIAACGIVRQAKIPYRACEVYIPQGMRARMVEQPTGARMPGGSAVREGCSTLWARMPDGSAVREGCSTLWARMPGGSAVREGCSTLWARMPGGSAVREGCSTLWARMPGGSLDLVGCRPLRDVGPYGIFGRNGGCWPGDVRSS